MRLQYYPTTFLTLLVGIGVSHSYGIQDAQVILWMVAGNGLLHCACSLINEYSDFVTGADLAEYPQTTWAATGGSRVLVDHLLSPGDVLVISLLFFFFSGGIWTFLALRVDLLLVLVLIGSVIIIFLYSAAFSHFGLHYVREVALTVGAVPLFVFSVVKILSGVYSVTAVIAGGVVGMQMLNYLLYHGLLDLQADVESGKLRLTRVLGAEKTIYTSQALMVGTYVVVALSVCTGLFPLGCAVTFFLVPLAALVMYAEVKRVDLVNTYLKVVFLFIGTSALLAVGFLL
jgi:1,4-dihydroxy-2-naphthoate octaprenyltransferase